VTASAGGRFLRGARDALVLPAWVIGFSLSGIGPLAREVGHPIEIAMASTLLVWAGPAQVLFYGSIAAGAAWGTIALAVCLSSLRFLPMTVSILPLLRRPGQGAFEQALLAHYVTVTTWTESLRRLPDLPVEGRVPYYLGFSNACILVSAGMTGVGYLLSGALPLTLGAGLLFLTPVFFTLSLTAGARALPDAVALVLGFALTPLATLLAGRGFDTLLTGVVAGTVAYLIGRARRRPADFEALPP